MRLFDKVSLQKDKEKRYQKLGIPHGFHKSGNQLGIGTSIIQRAVSCPCGGGCPRCLGVQAKLKVNPPGDRYEQEADIMAEQLMRMPDPVIQSAPTGGGGSDSECPDEEAEMVQTKPLTAEITPVVQRQVEPEDMEVEQEEDVLQRQPKIDDVRMEEEDEDVLQRQEVEGEFEEDLEEEEPLQRQLQDEEESVQAKLVEGAAPKVSAGLEGRIRGLKGSGAPLLASERDYFEPRLGLDLEPVRVHDSATAQEMASDLRARAFTHGTDIFFSTGQYSPGTEMGRLLLAHELVHVAQQTGGQTSKVQRLILSMRTVPYKLVDKALRGDDDDVRALTHDDDWDLITLTADQAAQLMIKLLDGYTGRDDQVAGLKVLYQVYRSNKLDETIIRLKKLNALTWMFKDYDSDAYRRLLDFLSRSIKEEEAAGHYLDEFISMTWVRQHEERAIVKLLDQISEIHVHPLLAKKNRESELRKAIDEPVYKKRYESIVEFSRPLDIGIILKYIRAGEKGTTPAEKRAAEEKEKKLKAAAIKLLAKALKGDGDDVRTLIKDEAWGKVDFTADQAAQLMILLLNGTTGNDDEVAGLKVLAKAKVRDVLDECLLALNNRGKFGQLLDDYHGEEYRLLLDFLSFWIEDVKVKALYLDKFISMTWVRTHEERAIVELLDRATPNQLKTLLFKKNRITKLRDAVDEHIFARRLEATIGKTLHAHKMLLAQKLAHYLRSNPKQAASKPTCHKPWRGLPKDIKRVFRLSFQNRKAGQWMWFMKNKNTVSSCWNTFCAKYPQRVRSLFAIQQSLASNNLWVYVDRVLDISSGNTPALTFTTIAAIEPQLRSNSNFCRETLLGLIIAASFGSSYSAEKYREVSPSYGSGLHIIPGVIASAHIDRIGCATRGPHGLCVYNIIKAIQHALLDLMGFKEVYRVIRHLSLSMDVTSGGKPDMASILTGSAYKYLPNAKIINILKINFDLTTWINKLLRRR